MEEWESWIREREGEKGSVSVGMRGGGGGSETEVWIIAAQWRLCLISEVSRPI